MKHAYLLKTACFRWVCIGVILAGSQFGCRKAGWQFSNQNIAAPIFSERIIPQQPCSRLNATSTESLLDRAKSSSETDPKLQISSAKIISPEAQVSGYGLERLPRTEPEIVRLPKPITEAASQSPICKEPELSMDESIDIAQAQNPALSEAKARIAIARAGKTMAFSAFLPEVYAASSLVGTNGDIRSWKGVELSGITFPITWESNFNRAELKAQWTIWDFGRRRGEYCQSDIMVQIANLQYQRACQTVAFDVSKAYYNVLQSRSSVVTAKDALRRGNEYLRVSRNLLEQGEADRESVFAAQLLVARAEQQCVAAETSVNTSTAELNKAMGKNTASPTQVKNISSYPNFQLSLLECLERAVENRREIRVVADWVAKAAQAEKIAKADFMPKVISTAEYHSFSGGLDADSKAGMIIFEWDVFSGGKRVGKLREEKAVVCEAIANAKKVCDQVAYEVNVAYQRVKDAQQRISLAKSALKFARERLRIVMNKFIQGEASPTDVIDAQTSLTLAQQTYHTTAYQFQSAKAQLEYAMGTNLVCGQVVTAVSTNHR